MTEKLAVPMDGATGAIIGLTVMRGAFSPVLLDVGAVELMTRGGGGNTSESETGDVHVYVEPPLDKFTGLTPLQ